MFPFNGCMRERLQPSRWITSPVSRGVFSARFAPKSDAGLESLLGPLQPETQVAFPR